MAGKRTWEDESPKDRYTEESCKEDDDALRNEDEDNLPTQTWGGGQGGLNLPLPVPFNPGSRPVFFGSRPFAFFRLRNIAQCCVIFPLFSRFPPPWESRFPPPLLPPPVHLPPPFLPVSRPPVPPHTNGSAGRFRKTQRHVAIDAYKAERQHVVGYEIDELDATSYCTACR